MNNLNKNAQAAQDTLPTAAAQAFADAARRPDADPALGKLVEQTLNANQEELQKHKDAFLAPEGQPGQQAGAQEQEPALPRSTRPMSDAESLNRVGHYAAEEVKRAINESMKAHTQRVIESEAALARAAQECAQLSEAFKAAHESHMQQVSTLTQEVELLRATSTNAPKSKLAKVADMMFTAAVIVNAGYIGSVVASRLYGSYKARQSEHSVVGTPGSDNYA